MQHRWQADCIKAAQLCTRNKQTHCEAPEGGEVSKRVEGPEVQARAVRPVACTNCRAVQLPATATCQRLLVETRAVADTPGTYQRLDLFEPDERMAVCPVYRFVFSWRNLYCPQIPIAYKEELSGVLKSAVPASGGSCETNR